MQRWHQQSGNADAVVYLLEPPCPNSPIRTDAPKSRVVSLGSPVDRRVLRTTSGRRSVVRSRVLDRRADDARDRADHVGTRADGPNEVFLTRKVPRQLGVDVGETLRLVRPDRRVVPGHRRRRARGAYGRAALILPPGMRRILDRPAQ